MNEPKDHFVTIRMPIELFKIVKELADGQTRSDAHDRSKAVAQGHPLQGDQQLQPQAF
jgi:hypothetical protein